MTSPAGRPPPGGRAACLAISSSDGPDRQAVADRLTESVREGDTVARLAGDEFTLLLPGIHYAEDLAAISRKLVVTMRQPFPIAGHAVRVTASGGISLYPDYQPCLDLATGRVVGMEALLRWQRPELGILEPKDFIALADFTGVILSVGPWVLETRRLLWTRSRSTSPSCAARRRTPTTPRS